MLINLILIINIILIGGILPLIERKYLAIIHRRLGPNYVGNKGKLQFLADSLKVFLKNLIFLKNLNNFLFILLPSLFFFIILFFWFNLIWKNNLFFFDIEYNLIFFLLIDISLNFIIILVGFFNKNKYVFLSINRLLLIFFNLEIFFSILLIYIYLINYSFSFLNFIKIQEELYGIFYFILLLPILILFFCIDLNRVPFDNVEAETEIIMGFHVEYSSFLFALFVLGEYLHIFFFSYLYILIFFNFCF